MDPIKLAGKKIALAYAQYMVDLLQLKYDTATEENVYPLSLQLQSAIAMLERVKNFYYL